MSQPAVLSTSKAYLLSSERTSQACCRRPHLTKGHASTWQADTFDTAFYSSCLVLHHSLTCVLCTQAPSTSRT